MQHLSSPDVLIFQEVKAHQSPYAGKVTLQLLQHLFSLIFE